MIETEFAKPLDKLGDSGIGVTAAPAGGKGLALGPSGQLPASVLSQIKSAWPSGTPDPGEEFVYEADATNGVYWRFKYFPTQATYPWVFIGGPPMTADVNTDEATSSTTYTDLATTTDTLTIPRGGDYIVTFGALMYNSTFTNINLMSISIGGAAAGDADAARHRANATTVLEAASWRIINKTALAANTTIKLKYRVTAGTGNFQFRHLTVLPLRVT